jgi:NADPH:quinone reductase-like Zn-dependent oxidoreductase
MRAMALKKYGPLEEMSKIDLPLPEPRKGEVRVRVHASALNPADYKVGLGEVKFMRARSFPMVLGNDFSGVIEAVGERSDWKIGESVFGFLPYGPFNRKGAFAETLIARTDQIALKPSGVSHIQAAAGATPGLTAIQGIRDAGKLLSSGGRVLITGVSGGVGSVAVSVAGKLGAVVVAIGSGRGIALAKQLGAGDVIDRKHQDVFASSGAPFDVIFDAAAAYRWRQWKGKIKSGGMYVTTLPSLPFLADKLRSVVAASGVAMMSVKSKPADLHLLGSWLESGLAITINSTIPVREVALGLARLKRGEVMGRVAVDVINGF